jgi:hypothetical protein
MSELEPERQGRRSAKDSVASGLRGMFFVVGSLFNLLAIILLCGGSVQMTRLWLTGGAVEFTFGQLAPFGAFVAGVLCYAIAYNLD